ncbi:MAG: cell wall-binding repeat-containing protein [Egibacteraceae bacterium]
MAGQSVGAALVAFVLLAAGGGTAAAQTPRAAAAPGCPSGPVALTFDDGPGVHTPAVLDLLAARGVPATFFPTGGLVDRHPGLVRRAAAEGHVVGNHTYGHENLTHLADALIHATVIRTTQAIQRAGVRAAPLVRPPYGATNARVHHAIRALGSVQLLWTVDPQDWRGHSPDTIAAHVLGRLAPGAVVVLHDGSPRTPNTIGALPRIIDEGRARGFCFGVLDDAGAVVMPAPPTPPPPAPKQVAPPQLVEVLSGGDRYATGVAVSRATWPGLVPAVVLAEGEAWADAVSGSVLAAAVGGPLLLTRGDRLDPGIAEELRRLAPEIAYLLGPLDPAVEDALWAQNIEVRRLRGPDRYTTSEMIADAAVGHGADPSTVVVATGDRFPDALAAAPLAAGQRHPILLARPSEDHTRLTRIVQRLGTARTWVVGGSAALPEVTVLGLPGMERIAGPTRTATAAVLATRAVQLGYASKPLVASGWSAPDGLTGSGLAARQRRPILLTGPAELSPDVHAWLRDHRSTAVTVLGGPAAVGPGALCQLRTGLDRPDAC